MFLERLKMEEQGEGNNGPEEALEEEDITREEHLPGEAFSLVVMGVILEVGEVEIVEVDAVVGMVEVVVADVEGEMVEVEVEVEVGEVVEVEDVEVGWGEKNIGKKLAIQNTNFNFL